MFIGLFARKPEGISAKRFFVINKNAVVAKYCKTDRQTVYPIDGDKAYQIGSTAFARPQDAKNKFNSIHRPVASAVAQRPLIRARELEGLR